MLQPSFTPLDFSYQKKEMGLWVLNDLDLPLDKSKIQDKQLVHFAAQAVGGNHCHARTEWLIGIGELEFFWLENDHLFKRSMNPVDQLLLIEVPSFLPHAVKNTSLRLPAFLMEYADAKMTTTEKIMLVSEGESLRVG